MVHEYIQSTRFMNIFSQQRNRIGGVMVSVLASSAVDRGFEPWSGQTKDYKIGICCFSAWLGIRIMCPSGATFLPRTVFFLFVFFLFCVLIYSTEINIFFSVSKRCMKLLRTENQHMPCHNI